MTTSLIETDIKKCKLLWQEFSPNKSLFDLWDFWFVFYSVYKPQPYFILLQKGNNNVGLLPLWYEKEKKRYYSFGGLYQEDISFWVKHPAYIPILLSLCPRQTFLKGIAIENAAIEKVKGFAHKEKKVDFGIDEPKYILNISGVKSFDNYLMSLKKERRKSIRKDIFLIEQQCPKVIIDNFRDFSYLITLIKQRFADEFSIEDENDPWAYPTWKDNKLVKAFLDTTCNKQDKYQPRILTVKIDGKIAGIDFIIIYNKCYYPFLCGYDVKNFPGIGNYLNMLNVKDALNLGLKKIDVLQGDCGWKHRWYQEQPLYYFSKE